MISSNFDCFDRSRVKSEQPHSLQRVMHCSHVPLSTSPLPVRALVTFTRFDPSIGRVMPWCSAYGICTRGFRKKVGRNEVRYRPGNSRHTTNHDPVYWDAPPIRWPEDDGEPMFGVAVFSVYLQDGYLTVGDVLALKAVSLAGMDRDDEDLRRKDGVFRAAHDFATHHAWKDSSLSELYDENGLVNPTPDTFRLIRDYGKVIVMPKSRCVRLGENYYAPHELGISDWYGSKTSFAAAT